MNGDINEPFSKPQFKKGVDAVLPIDHPEPIHSINVALDSMDCPNRVEIQIGFEFS